MLNKCPRGDVKKKETEYYLEKKKVIKHPQKLEENHLENITGGSH